MLPAAARATPTVTEYDAGLTRDAAHGASPPAPTARSGSPRDGKHAIGRITPDGAITEFTAASPAAARSGITAGPDGNLWFTETGARQRSAGSPRPGSITEFPRA